MKVAYLDANIIKNVSAECGAICLTDHNDKHRYIPIKWLRSIYVTGHVNWTAQAIKLCLKSSCQVYFISPKTGLAGILSSTNLENNQTLMPLEQYLIHSERPIDTRLWYQSRERLMIMKEIKPRHCDLLDLRPQAVWQRLYAELGAAHPGFDFDALDKKAKGLLAAWLLTELQQHGISQAILLKPAKHADIKTQLNIIISWWLRARYQHWIRTGKEAFLLEIAFENVTAKLFHVFRQEIKALLHWLNDNQNEH